VNANRGPWRVPPEDGFSNKARAFSQTEKVALSSQLLGWGRLFSGLGERQFVLGTEEASDVWTLVGQGVAPRYAWV
jgi:hypothetical protein